MVDRHSPETARPQQGFTPRLSLGHPATRCMGLLLSASLVLLQSSQAQNIPKPTTASPFFVIQETQKHYLPEPAETLQTGIRQSRPGQPAGLDRDTVHKPTKAHGIVGLDLLIYADAYPIIQDVFPQTPADRAGLLPGDIIVAINGVHTARKSRSEIDIMISDQPGDLVSFTIERDGQLRRIKLTVVDAASLTASLRPGFARP